MAPIPRRRLPRRTTPVLNPLPSPATSASCATGQFPRLGQPPPERSGHGRAPRHRPATDRTIPLTVTSAASAIPAGPAPQRLGGGVVGSDGALQPLNFWGLSLTTLRFNEGCEKVVRLERLWVWRTQPREAQPSPGPLLSSVYYTWLSHTGEPCQLLIHKILHLIRTAGRQLLTTGGRGNTASTDANGPTHRSGW